ncbi:hypothetical protein SAMN04488136_12837 [Vibrio xiamenensis]|uniref:Immunity MXAN-0049 protein domain-containing protein n=1 Tax=Vibrio xiamenensis TaxID=861298 RepID=A0A1G8F3L6_9VIBR|nr:DUF1629 domain-containing protein [Vibrio xiamenensis]SDH76745.1 hypothetical protein SAMN04488136_12837 [Vibrio xiamenensis]
MNYYKLVNKFEDGEGSFTVQEPWDEVLEYFNPQYKIMKIKASVLVDEYKEKGMSDFLKIGLGKLASKKIQKIFFDNGISGIQFVPVEVENNGKYTEYAFMNVIAHYDLLDPVSSNAKKFSDALGGYTRVRKEIIDQKKLDSLDIKHDCFTLSTYKESYYVSERVKDILEKTGVSGIKFKSMEIL